MLVMDVMVLAMILYLLGFNKSCLKNHCCELGML